MAAHTLSHRERINPNTQQRPLGHFPQRGEKSILEPRGFRFVKKSKMMQCALGVVFSYSLLLLFFFNLRVQSRRNITFFVESSFVLARNFFHLFVAES